MELRSEAHHVTLARKPIRDRAIRASIRRCGFSDPLKRGEPLKH